MCVAFDQVGDATQVGSAAASDIQWPPCGGGAGLSNADIAERLTVSPHTVRTHVKRSMAKLGAHDRAHLVAIAYETGLVRPATG